MEALDLGVRGALGAGRGDVLSELAAWIEGTFGHAPRDLSLFTRAVTHSSREGEASYERLEFLGDRVLGIAMAEWLYELFPDEPEGKLSRRFNLLVSGATCAEVARAIGVVPHLRLNKQAYNDGVGGSDYVLGDVVEALLGALHLDGGAEAARAWVRRTWADRVRGEAASRKHPKAELQDWAAANGRGVPAYDVAEVSGPDHARRHTVVARLGAVERSATGTTKREAETEAARALMAAILAEEPPAAKRRKRPPYPRGARPVKRAQ